MAGKLATVLLTLAATIQSACSGEEPNRDGVDFFFTDAEWTKYGRRIERSNRSDFSLSVRMGEHRESVRATAHLRGRGSFRCARRNYTLNLYGKRPRFASLDSVTDEFYLLSLCRDHGYVRQHTVLKLWSRLGLFPLQLRYVELTLNGRSQGVYLLVEKLDRIRFSRSGLRALLRRDFRFVKTVVEVKYSRTGEQEARSDYEKTFEEFAGLSGEPLVARFRELMNLDQYLLWLASNALLQNGDSVDELWLLAEDNPTPQARARPYYTFFAWDPDDVFNPCHSRLRERTAPAPERSAPAPICITRSLFLFPLLAQMRRTNPLTRKLRSSPDARPRPDPVYYIVLRLGPGRFVFHSKFNPAVDAIRMGDMRFATPTSSPTVPRRSGTTSCLAIRLATRYMSMCSRTSSRPD